MKTEFLQNFKVGDQALPKEIIDGVSVEDLQGKITALTGQLADKDKAWQAKLDGMAFDGRIKEAITAAKGRNAKAIAALLDVEALRASKNQDGDIKAALETLKKENGYLFDDDPPARYASGTGTQQISTKYTAAENAIRAAAGLKVE